MVQAMDQEVVERTCKLWIREQTNVQAVDQGAVEGDIDGASDGRSNGWYKRWITKQSKEIYGSGSC